MFLKWGGGFAVFTGGVLTVIGYHQGGDSWPQAIGKGVIATAFSFGGALIGGSAGCRRGSRSSDSSC